MTSPYANREDLRTGFQSDRSQRITRSRERREQAEFKALCRELEKQNRTEDDRLVDRERTREYREQHPDRVAIHRKNWRLKNPGYDSRRRGRMCREAGPVQCQDGCGTEWCRVPGVPGRPRVRCLDCQS